MKQPEPPSDPTERSAATSPEPGLRAAPGPGKVTRPAPRPAVRAEAVPRDALLSEIRFLTVAEVAAVMRVSRMTVYRMVHSEELPAVRVGRSFRVPEHAVHEYLRTAFNDVG